MNAKRRPRRQVVTAAEAGRILGISPKSLRRALAAGELPSLAVGRRWYVDVGVLEQRLGRTKTGRAPVSETGVA